MNERIEKLYKQASKQDYFPQDGEEVYMSAEDLKKFAELLVQECVSICYAESRTAGANGNLAEYSALSRAGGHIKDHFGVE